MDDLTLAVLAKEYGERCCGVGLERCVADLQDAMHHPGFQGEHHALLDRLAKEYRASLPLPERGPLLTLTLGTWQSKEEMVTAVKDSGYQLSEWVLGVVGNKNFVLLDEPGEYEFFEATVKELTGRGRATTAEIYAAQQQMGFCVAPHESACAIRLAFINQSMDDWRYVLSQPVADASGGLVVLDVERHSRGSEVGWVSATPNGVWGGSYQLLVCRKK